MGWILDEDSLEWVGFPCEGPIVHETRDLFAFVLGRGSGVAAVLATDFPEGRASTLEVYDVDEGWARTPAAPVDLLSARLAMLDDGSVIAVGGRDGDADCSDQVWRWVP